MIEIQTLRKVKSCNNDKTWCKIPYNKTIDKTLISKSLTNDINVEILLTRLERLEIEGLLSPG